LLHDLLPPKQGNYRTPNFQIVKPPKIAGKGAQKPKWHKTPKSAKIAVSVKPPKVESQLAKNGFGSRSSKSRKFHPKSEKTVMIPTAPKTINHKNWEL
jgi:hypothetical protein